MGQEFNVWKIRTNYPFRLEYRIKTCYLLSVETVIPRNLNDLLFKDVALHGNIQGEWLTKLLRMKKALLLRFGDAAMLNGQKRLEASS